MLDAVFDLQRTLYAGALNALETLASGGAAAAPGLIAMAFGFGALHALLPGHGKAVLASYYAAEGKWLGALSSSAILIVTHVGSAIVLVLSGFLVLRRTIGGAGRAPALEVVSGVLIAATGLCLLWRAARPHRHEARESGAVLAVAAGLVPCPLTTFIMTYAAAKGVAGAGLVLSSAFAVGMIATVAAFPIAAVLLRARLVRTLSKKVPWRERAAKGLEVMAATGVTSVGLWQLAAV